LPIVPLLIRNQLTFGAFSQTAYALTHEQTGFGLDYFRQHAILYVQSLLSDGVGVLLPLALLGIVLMISIPGGALGADAGERRARAIRPFGILAALLVLPTTLLCMAYYWGGMRGGNGTMRFLLPLFPLLTVTAIWALWLLTRQVGRAPRVAAVSVILLVHVLWGVPASLQQCRRLAYDNQVLARATAALREHVPPGSVVMANQGMLHHLDFIRAWRLADPGLARAGRMLPSPAREDDDTPRPMQAGKRQAQTAPCEGPSGIARERAVVKDIQAWADGGDMYFVGTEAEAANMAGAYFNSDNLQVIGRVALPEAPAEAGMAGAPGAGGPPAGQRGQRPALAAIAAGGRGKDGWHARDARHGGHGPAARREGTGHRQVGADGAAPSSPRPQLPQPAADVLSAPPGRQRAQGRQRRGAAKLRVPRRA
jgi:hypothetical protein